MLQPKIKAMAHRQLGKAFLSLEQIGPMLVLNVRVGTATGKLKYTLNDLLGWIRIFDAKRGRTEHKKKQP